MQKLFHSADIVISSDGLPKVCGLDNWKVGSSVPTEPFLLCLRFLRLKLKVASSLGTCHSFPLWHRVVCLLLLEL